MGIADIAMLVVIIVILGYFGWVSTPQNNR
jgi:hypothetical protein